MEVLTGNIIYIQWKNGSFNESPCEGSNGKNHQYTCLYTPCMVYIYLHLGDF